MADYLALHAALLRRLNEALPCPVYDAVPQGAAFPYVTLDTQTAAPADALSSPREQRFVYLGVWSEVHGQAEVLRLMGAIKTALHRQRLAVDSGHVVSLSVERCNTIREPDNRTYMGRVTLRLLTQP